MVTNGHTDVFVCGGGPAGLAAAIAARQRGFRVALADCFRPPIDKACGEGLMPDALDALGALGVSLDSCDTGTFRGIRFLGPQHTATAEFPSGHGIGIRRTMLHNVLVERARSLGVEMFWGSRVTAVGADFVHLDNGSVRCRWIVGADGHNSQVRNWAGLQAGRNRLRRIGLRRHYALAPWSEFVEIYWGPLSQMYVTPVAPGEICVASISRSHRGSFDDVLQEFPQLRARLGATRALSSPKGAPTVTRTLRRVTAGNVALVGEASGSCDAITGEGLAMGFRQALALAAALAGNDLETYERAHRKISALPHTMARAMLLMDGSDWIRARALRAFHSQPQIFQRLLSLHVGEVSPSSFGFSGALRTAWNLVTA